MLGLRLLLEISSPNRLGVVSVCNHDPANLKWVTRKYSCFPSGQSLTGQKSASSPWQQIPDFEAATVWDSQKGRSETWTRSRQAYTKPQGDCLCIISSVIMCNPDSAESQIQSKYNWRRGALEPCQELAVYCSKPQAVQEV